ncbi:helix-turn-helix domain-containing protein [Caulobacter sp. RL271]|uniref:Helix-turn-helix domain-containing protein n=1 Tax=Caulobacter segnis TaxID=88688 RepID=A0ABY4ZRC4_9CAUL|nr:helix-turn-helix transcriptional regulator [Caulobacter segnis]USQ95283.1 helix-turn-helix domain-containing protein [Caulobacter segnis]
MSNDNLDPEARITAHVALRLRIRRRMQGLTLDQLAEKASVTPQQIQKYERGLNRVSASKLLQLARALNAPVNYFYDGLQNGGQMSADVEDGLADFLRADDAPALVSAINRIQVRSTRRRLLQLVQAIADEQP